MTRYSRIALLVIVLAWNAWAGTITVKVTNPAGYDRPGATVEVPRELLKGLTWQTITVRDAGAVIPSQTIDADGNGDPEMLLFQSSFVKGGSKEFIIDDAGEQPAAESPTDVKYVLPRKDVAWENDRIAYRIYGSPLAGDVLNGIDVWVKRVRHHVIDTWYRGDSLKGKERISYHVDHGEGADFFTVGRTLGCGSTALWSNGVVDQSGLFASYTILATGPVRLMFRVTYEKQSSAGTPYREERVISLDAGNNLNRVEVSYPGMTREGTVIVAAGLVKRRGTGTSSDEREGWAGLWGPTNDDSTNGDLGLGIVMPMESFRGVVEDSLHCYVLGTTSPEKRMIYYTGAGWTRSGDFATKEAWNAYLASQSEFIRNPLRVDAVQGEE